MGLGWPWGPGRGNGLGVWGWVLGTGSTADAGPGLGLQHAAGVCVPAPLVCWQGKPEGWGSEDPGARSTWDLAPFLPRSVPRIRN